MSGKNSFIWFLLYLVFGIFFINQAFVFITIPEFISNLDRWITFVGGILILVGGINYLRTKKDSL